MRRVVLSFCVVQFIFWPSVWGKARAAPDKSFSFGLLCEPSPALHLDVKNVGTISRQKVAVLYMRVDGRLVATRVARKVAIPGDNAMARWLIKTHLWLLVEDLAKARQAIGFELRLGDDVFYKTVINAPENSASLVSWVKKCRRAFSPVVASVGVLERVKGVLRVNRLRKVGRIVIKAADAAVVRHQAPKGSKAALLSWVVIVGYSAYDEMQRLRGSAPPKKNEAVGGLVVD
jgi:hypothetical protein